MIGRVTSFLALICVVIASFIGGLLYRDWISQKEIPTHVEQYLSSLVCPDKPTQVTSTLVTKEGTSPPKPETPVPTVQPRRANFTGPQLFEAINTRRTQYGVGKLGQNDEFCSLASYRLNQLLPTGKLDNHAGFIALSEDSNSPFADLFKRYSVAEFLVFVPYGTATDAVAAWDDTLGHKILLNGGQFTLGCAYAQQGIGVAIAGY